MKVRVAMRWGRGVEGVVDRMDGCDSDGDIDRRGEGREGIGLFRYLLNWLVG